MSRSLVRAILVAALLLGLSGCVTPEELRQQDEAACSSYGFHPGTSDFAACLQRENLARRYGGWSAPPPMWYGGGWHRFP
ncbi:MAG TPA: hypothetical protein VN668_12120 [Stellaceae bacterium]|nr:hypothetical protein [Stellaceae bacterium]